QHRVVARHHPGADVPALLERNVAPGFVAGLARTRDGPRAPQLLPGLGIVRGDHAAIVGGLRLTLAPFDDLAVGDDRTRAGVDRLLRVEDRCLPDQLSGAGV